MEQCPNPSLYSEYTNSAIKHIKKRMFKEAKGDLLKAIVENVESPVAYNLFGALYEYASEQNRAIKFYRIAYYFDATYMPARNNLDRATKVWGEGISKIDFGGE